MELLNLSVISRYKNLEGLNIRFSHKQNTYVIIGNNGSGKSSILEALSSIFSTLFDNLQNRFEFDFNIVYKLEGRKISLTQKKDNISVKIDGVVSSLAELRATALPSKVICNYSGEEIRIKEKYYATPFDNYIESIKNAVGGNSLNMIFIDKELWSVILLIMLTCREEWAQFKTFIEETLMLPKLMSVHLEIDERQLSTWTDNPVTYYVKRIKDQITADGTIDIANINPDGDDPMVLFNLWNSARPLISCLKITFDNNIDATMLSEGEKKLMVILFIQEAIADEKALVLLDEPDSHIHVARKSELKKFFGESVNRMNVLTSHSPTLTAMFPGKSIIMLDRQPNGAVSVIKRNKQEIVEKLTAGIWSIQEQNIFLASNKTILIVEGKTDEQIISAALDSHKQSGNYQDLDFCYLPAGGASSIQLIAEKFTPKKGQMMIAFFDFDKAGLDAIRKIFEDNELTKDNFGKARKKGMIWFSYYPSCKKSVADFNIEDYFPRSVFLRYVMQFKGLKTLCSESNLKNKIAADCENRRMTSKQFANFIHLFDRIIEISEAENNGQVEI